jgi:hypothetical protein
MSSPTYTSIYGIQLLDDLHNYFPEILYNPTGFNSVRDVLQYIQRTTQHRFDLYSYGRNLAMPSMAANASVAAANANATANANYFPNAVANANAAANANYFPNATASTTTPLVPMASLHTPQARPTGPLRIVRQRITPLTMLGSASSLSFDDIDQASNDILTSMLANLIRTPAAFNEPVIVRPTEAQIAAATRVEQLISPSDAICTICQDDFLEENTEIRKITACGHFFHKSCIDEWFERNVRCPVCRHDIRTAPTASGGAGSTANGNVATTSH